MKMKKVFVLGFLVIFLVARVNAQLVNFQEIQFWILNVSNQVTQIQQLIRAVQAQERVFKTLAKGGFNNFLSALQMQFNNVARVSSTVNRYANAIDQIDQRTLRKLNDAKKLYSGDSLKTANWDIKNIQKVNKIKAKIEYRSVLSKRLREMERSSYAMSNIAWKSQSFLNGEKSRGQSWDNIFNSLGDADSPTQVGQLSIVALSNVSGQLSDLLEMSRSVNQATLLKDKILQERAEEQRRLDREENERLAEMVGYGSLFDLVDKPKKREVYVVPGLKRALDKLGEEQ